jgi:hypothetical protein
MIAGLQQNSSTHPPAWQKHGDRRPTLWAVSVNEGMGMRANKWIVGVVSAVLAAALGTAHAGISKTPAKLTLEWAPSEKSVIGYDVYYGRTPAVGKMQVLPAMPEFDLKSPSLELDVLRDLGALPGQRVCFRIRAYSRVSQSALSPAMCAVI